MKNQIFICYKQNNNNATLEFCKELKSVLSDTLKKSIFLDLSMIKGGDHIERTIGKAIKDSIVMVAVIDYRWMSLKNEKWLLYELRCAKKRKIPIIPVVVDSRISSLSDIHFTEDLKDLSNIRFLKMDIKEKSRNNFFDLIESLRITFDRKDATQNKYRQYLFAVLVVFLILVIMVLILPQNTVNRIKVYVKDRYLALKLTDKEIAESKIEGIIVDGQIDDLNDEGKNKSITYHNNDNQSVDTANTDLSAKSDEIAMISVVQNNQNDFISHEEQAEPLLTDNNKTVPMSNEELNRIIEENLINANDLVLKGYRKPENWVSVINSIKIMPSNDRKRAIVNALLLAKEHPRFDLYGKDVQSGFNSPELIKYILQTVGLSIKNNGRLASVALMETATPIDTPEPGDLVFYKGKQGNFGLFIIYIGENDSSSIGVGTLQKNYPGAIYDLVMNSNYPKIGYFHVAYNDER